MALSELRLRDGPSSADLARIAFVTPQAMSLVIRDLERRGLIRRDPQPGAGRVPRARLTRKGLPTLRRCDRAAASALAAGEMPIGPGACSGGP
ncbi:MarR family winged helix-turn-helix transcriptional regulator [Nonomuraea sp. NPDC003201]